MWPPDYCLAFYTRFSSLPAASAPSVPGVQFLYCRLPLADDRLLFRGEAIADNKEIMMSNSAKYGQFCPLSVAAEFLCNRWTLLLLREMVFGSQTFNDISRGVPRMSRTLLSKRLKELGAIGLIEKFEEQGVEHSRYRLTPAGEALRPVIFTIADWSQEWLNVEPSLENIDPDLLMWNIRRHARHQDGLPDPFIVKFHLPDQPSKKQDSWLVFEKDEVDLCVIDRDFDVDVEVHCSSEVLTRIWMGWADFDEQVANGQLKLFGPADYTRPARQWLGCSRLAGISKQPSELLVG
jgi:DNA-binding HxlR family transcriptional regulator